MSRRASVAGSLAAMASFVVMSAIALDLRAEQAGDEPPSDRGAAARRHFERGVGFFHEQHYQAAIEAFRTSFEINPLPQVLFNIAIAQRDAGQGGAALTTLRRYVALSASEPEERRSFATALISELDEALATVTVRSEPLEAQIFVDGESLGELPLDDPLRLSEGEHDIELRHQGYQSHREHLELAPGETREIDFQLTAERRRWSRSWWFWTLVGVGVAAAGTAVGLAIGLTREPAGADFQVAIERGRTP